MYTWSEMSPFHFSIIKHCLSIWTKSPAAYEHLRQSGLLILPSQRHLQRHKNAIPQGPGIQPHMLEWLSKEAERTKVPASGMEGGLIFDEMSIQVTIYSDFIFTSTNPIM